MEKNVSVLLSNINGYPLDEAQKKVVLSDSPRVLVSAGAGCGKTFTILGKIRYLIEVQNIKEEEILCISFTNDATDSLRDKLKSTFGYDITCYTFHKLGLEILKKDNYKICDSDFLGYVIWEFFKSLEDFDSIKRVLSFLKIKFNSFNYRKKYQDISKDSFDELGKLIQKFIALFKANDYLPSEFSAFIKKSFGRERDFLVLCFYIYYTYQKELDARKEIDFSDMISRGTRKVFEYGFFKKTKYIIIDEFQDTSVVRFNLIKEILNKTNAKLLVVGDDFQSIYRFTGCDLDLFLNFRGIFGDCEILKLENTYRNSQELVSLAGSFICKNKNQLFKDLKSNKHLDFPVRINYYKNIVSSFCTLIENIHNTYGGSIMVLGRNNFDINPMLQSGLFSLEGDTLVYSKNKEIKMCYLTVHRAKGLEDDYVIVLNMSDKKLGFPNKISDEKVLRFVSCKGDDYLFAEERRLFYVAITRTKNITYLMVPYSGESCFVTEIKKNYKDKVKVLRKGNL